MNIVQDKEKNTEAKFHNDEVPSEGTSIPQLNYMNMSIFCIIISLSGLPIGWDIGTIGYIINTPTFKQTYGELHENEARLSSVMVGVIISSFNMGCIIGCLGLSKITPRIGFKGTIFVSNFIYLLGSTMQVMSGWFQLNVWLMILGRICCGICCGTLCVLVPRYLNQLILAPRKDVYLSFFQTSICLAILAGNVANFAFKQDYLKILSSQISIILATSCLATIIPESHLYYISRNEIKKASAVIKKLHYKITEDQVYHLASQGAMVSNLPKAWIWNEQYYKPLIQCCTVMVFQQLSGINYFFYYGNIIFNSLGINTALVSIILSVVNLVGSLTSNVIIGKFGRIQLLLIIGSASMSVLLTTYVILAYISTPITLTFTVIITCLFIATFAITWGPIPGILITRISCNSNEMIGLANFVNYTTNCLITIITPIMINAIGFNFSILFIASLLLLIIYIYYMSSKSH